MKDTIDYRKPLKRLLRDRERINRMLALEKSRRELASGDLVFVGMRNVAQHWWCTEQAVLDSRACETDFFAAYLHDRISTAFRLRLANKLPKSDEAILDLGRDISFDEVENLFRQDQDQAEI